MAITGGKDIADPAAVIERLDKTRAKYADMILVHGGGPGVEKIAASWAERNGVHQIVCKPDWDRHGRAAPFRRNEELLNLLPKGVIAFPGSGITENLVDRARQLGIPVSAASRPEPTRAESLRWRGPFFVASRSPAHRGPCFAPRSSRASRRHRPSSLRSPPALPFGLRLTCRRTTLRKSASATAHCRSHSHCTDTTP